MPVFLRSFTCPARKWSRKYRSRYCRSACPRSSPTGPVIAQTHALWSPWGRFCWPLQTYQNVLQGQQRRQLTHKTVTILIFFRDLASVILIFLFFQLGNCIYQHREIQNANLFIENILVYFILSLLGNRNTEILIDEAVTSNNVDEIVEANTSISLLGLLECSLQLSLLVFV